MSAIHELGKKGEELAADFLRGKGYVILETNWRFHHNELDVIAQDGAILVVVEVKTRRSDLFGEPELAVGPGKQRVIIRSANAWVKLHRWLGETRFDIVSVILNEAGATIRHLPDAFGPGIN